MPAMPPDAPKIGQTRYREGNEWVKKVVVSRQSQAPSIYGDITLRELLILESEFAALFIQ